ncbi:uncharacterized protein KGF55_003260 [Candida pseudojiufengensis]|uniref:uncharacterized protein n=1 Tax=Candida pseudojiufengensis TaxID=497109 RepID=UPI00222586F5|nr:uncharacterized protein KGF55_003260 [Candida pseudojiufengensis]KAI5962184.1 hypothetical protein KGF55_003260 [Candida pseudojiufengensis]
MTIKDIHPSSTILPPEYSKSSEILPNYNSSLNYYGLAILKIEFNTPYHYNNSNRSWKPVLLHMNSTQLNIYNLKCDKKLKDLIINLYFELNNLNQLTIDVNNEFKIKNGIDFNSFSNLNNNDLDDIFAGDAYGGNNINLLDSNNNGFFSSSSSSSLLNQTNFDKFKTKIKNNKNKKILSNISQYYDILKDNRLLFEASDNETSTFKNLKGTLLNSYSLNNLQIGEAPSLNQLISAMYKEDTNLSSSIQTSSLVKYKNCLRLRIEYKQILLQFWSFNSMINWFRNLSIGKDLSLPLEFRTITKLKSIPSRYSNRNNALLAATAAAANHGRYSISSSSDEVHEERSHFLSFKDSVNSDIFSSTTSIEEDSIFENRRESINSATSSTTSSSLEISKSIPQHITINNYDFITQDFKYSTIEKQYISNCIPDLNSFDKWNGKLCTISNVEFFIKDDKNLNEKDLFVSYAFLNDLVLSFDKKFQNQSIKKPSSTKTFLIHQSGLVGVN